MIEDDPIDATAGRRVRREGEPALKLSAVPIGRTARFVEAVRARHGRAYVDSWLSGQTCEFEDCVIWTLGYSRARINRECADLITAHRIVIKERVR